MPVVYYIQQVFFLIAFYAVMDVLDPYNSRLLHPNNRPRDPFKLLFSPVLAPNSCILFIKNRKKEYTHNRVVLYAVRGFFTRGRLSLLTLYCKTHSGQHMDEYNLHYYIARWNKSDPPGGLEFYKGDIWGLKMDLNWVVIHIQVYSRLLTSSTSSRFAASTFACMQ